MGGKRGLMAAAALLGLAASFALGARSRAGVPEGIAPPARLSETGLYADPESLAVDPRHRPFAPQYPLWTDGAAKARWIHLPEGSAIDVSDVETWRFPVGTKLWKEFSFGGRRVETRLVWRATEETWIFAAYVWNEEQTEAILAPQEGVPDLVEIAPGKRHSIPSLADCASCHRSSPSTVLGFSALQLSDDRDPLAPHAEPLRPGMVTLRTLDAEGLLSPPRRDLVESPPRIAASTPRERAVRGYLAANCGHCHNGTGPLARLGLVLAHEEGALASAVDVPGRYEIPGLERGGSRLLAPGDPGRSAIVHRMRSRRPSSQMPPVGTALRDEEGVRLIESWVREDLGR